MTRDPESSWRCSTSLAHQEAVSVDQPQRCAAEYDAELDSVFLAAGDEDGIKQEGADFGVRADVVRDVDRKKLRDVAVVDLKHNLITLECTFGLRERKSWIETLVEQQIGAMKILASVLSTMAEISLHSQVKTSNRSAVVSPLESDSFAGTAPHSVSTTEKCSVASSSLVSPSRATVLPGLVDFGELRKLVGPDSGILARGCPSFVKPDRSLVESSLGNEQLIHQLSHSDMYRLTFDCDSSQES